MITFGYKSKFSSILRACAAAAIGLVMIAATNAAETVVQIIAAFLFAAGVVSLIYGYSKRESGHFPLMSVNALIDVIIGIILFVAPSSVANLIPQLIGVALLIFGLFQFIVLAGTLSLVGSGGFSLILSILAFVGGAILVFNPFTMGVMRVLAGVFLLVYGISELMSMFRVSKAQEAYEVKFGKATSSDDSEEASSAEYTTSYGPSVNSEPGKLDTSGIADAKEVEFEKED